MPLYFNGTLVHVSHPASFKGSDGSLVDYFVNILASSDGSITINSKRDFSSYLNRKSVITLTARAQDKKLYKLSLTDIKPLDEERTII